MQIRLFVKTVKSVACVRKENTQSSKNQRDSLEHNTK